MTLHALDEIQIDGIRPRNPVTDAIVPDLLQWFIVTCPQEGDWIDPRALHPWCPEDEPISMGRVMRVNGVNIQGVRVRG